MQTAQLQTMEQDPRRTDKCPVCLLGVPQPFLDGKWTWRGQTFRLVRCSACQCAHSDPIPSNSTLQDLYASGFDYRWYEDHYAAKVRDCRLRIKEYEPVLGRRVLDFGGGLGYFSRVAREAGLDSITYDPYANHFIAQDETWDCVVALHVLEHSNDLDHTIAQLRSLIRPDGRLVLAVPNFAGQGYREQGMAWVWAQPPVMHVFHFTEQGLRALLGRHGFTDITASYHERWDANLVSDVEQATKFRYLDGMWAREPYNSIALLRKLIAWRNSRARFRALKTAHAQMIEGSDIYSELQIVARFSGNGKSTRP